MKEKAFATFTSYLWCTEYTYEIAWVTIELNRPRELHAFEGKRLLGVMCIPPDGDVEVNPNVVLQQVEYSQGKLLSIG